MVRLLLVNDFYLCGGAETAFRNAEKALGNVHDVEVHKFFFMRRPNHLLAPLSIINPLAFISLALCILRTKPDVVYIHNFTGVISILGMYAIAAYKVLLKRRITILLSLHDYSLFSPSPSLLFFRKNKLVTDEGGNRSLAITVFNSHKGSAVISAGKYLRWKISASLMPISQIDHVLAPSKFMQEFARRKLKCESILLFPNPVVDNMDNKEEFIDHPVFRCDQPGRPILGFFGRNAPEKGLEELLKELANIDFEVEVRVYSALSSSDVRRISALPVGLCRLVICNEVPHHQIEECFRGLTCVIVPSVWVENAPMIISEALSNAIPVVVRRIGSLEIIAESSDMVFSYRNSAELSTILRSIQNTQFPPSTLKGELYTEFQENFCNLLEQVNR
jgi:glycosyltransferase involved in cell wall biosynthesis